MSRTARILSGLLIGGAALGASGVAGQTPAAQRPEYLPFAPFASDDSAPQITAKREYNDAVERYNKALYDYHVTLGQHDQLVDLYNRAGTPGEQEKARADAAPLRAKLQTLGREVKTLAAAVDQARRKASQAGVSFTR